MTFGSTVEQEEITRLLYGFRTDIQKQISHDLEKEKAERVIVIAGPTAVGKTGFGLDLAKMLGGEIISADSMQVYRGMDVGTAKATETERADVPHHMVDIREVSDPLNVVDFYYEGRKACKSILARNRVPVVVGGSGFYIHTFIYGPPSGPPSVASLRAEIEREIEKMGPEVAYERLQELDPDYAATITHHDRQKIARALEIIKLTEQPVSALDWGKVKHPTTYDFRCWFVYRPKEILYRRIDERCDEMIAQGLLDEASALLQEGLLENPSARQAIGYRQALKYLQSPQSASDYETFVGEFKQASRRYAKRQFTWFRREPMFRWLDIELHDPETAQDIIACDYSRR